MLGKTSKSAWTKCLEKEGFNEKNKDIIVDWACNIHVVYLGKCLQNNQQYPLWIPNEPDLHTNMGTSCIGVDVPFTQKNRN